MPSYLTYKCSNWTIGEPCPYCVNRQAAGPQADTVLPAKTWLKFWKSLPPHIIELTGGEPASEYPEFTKLIRDMPSQHVYAISTNLNEPLGYWKRLLPKLEKSRRCVSISCSLHLHPKLDFGDFLSKFRYLYQRATVPCQVNMCAYPRHDYMEAMPTVHAYFEKHHLPFHVETYICPPDKMNGKYSADFETWWMVNRPRDRLEAGWDKELVDKPRLCNAGCEAGYFIATSNGDCYRCNMCFYYTDPEDRKEQPYYLGNFAEGTFKPLGHAAGCAKPCSYGFEQRVNNTIFLVEEARFHSVGRSGKVGYESLVKILEAIA